MPHSVSPKAVADLEDIWVYVATESGSAEIANRLIDSITDRFQLLATYPYAGRQRNDDLGQGRRSFPSGEYVIIYRVGRKGYVRQRTEPDIHSLWGGRCTRASFQASFRTFFQMTLRGPTFRSVGAWATEFFP